MNAEITLLPCPFCGGTARKHLVEETIIHTKYWGVICDTCYCGTTGYQDYNKAVKAWNTRKPNQDVGDDEKTCHRQL